MNIWIVLLSASKPDASEQSLCIGLAFTVLIALAARVAAALNDTNDQENNDDNQI